MMNVCVPSVETKDANYKTINSIIGREVETLEKNNQLLEIILEGDLDTI